MLLVAGPVGEQMALVAGEPGHSNSHQFQIQYFLNQDLMLQQDQFQNQQTVTGRQYLSLNRN